MTRATARLRRSAADPEERMTIAVGAAALVMAMAGMAMFLNSGTYDVAMSMVVLVVIVLVSFVVFRRLADADQDPELLWILLGALVAKMMFALLRFWMVNKLYGGSGDSNRYDIDGWRWAEEVRSGTLVPAFGPDEIGVAGTGRIVQFTGYMYAVIGRSKFSGFFIYSWLAFWGCLLFVRGARRAFPELGRRRYLLLVMFWPSLLFWPSSIGKDAVMLFLLGVASYGAFAVLAPRARWWGIAPIAAGVGGMLLIRSHVALMAVLALAVATGFAFIGGTRADNTTGRGRSVRIVALAALVVLAFTAVSQTTRFFSDRAGEARSSEEALQETARRTQRGGSQFDPILVTTPNQVPAAAVSVLFRPFIWEAGGVAALISAAEGALIAVMIALSWRRLSRWPGWAWRRPILIYALVYCLMFVVAFSSIGNAGILARQRVQMLPLLLLALAVPAVSYSRFGAGTEPEVPEEVPERVASGVCSGSSLGEVGAEGQR